MPSERQARYHMHLECRGAFTFNARRLTGLLGDCCVAWEVFIIVIALRLRMRRKQCDKEPSTQLGAPTLIPIG